MSLIFRGNVIFTYYPQLKIVKAMYLREYDIIAFNHCNFLIEDYNVIAEFFNTVYRHMNDENVELKDIELD